MIESANATAPNSDVAVMIEDGDWDSLDQPVQICEAAVHAALAEAQRRDDIGVGILLADDRRVGELNERFRGKPGPTNVLAFPSGEDHGVEASQPHSVGDIAIAFQTVAAEARQQGKPLADHLSHLVVHGALHLLGFDHQNDTQATEMEEMERRALRRLAINPYRALPEPDDE